MLAIVEYKSSGLLRPHVDESFRDRDNDRFVSAVEDAYGKIIATSVGGSETITI